MNKIVFILSGFIIGTTVFSQSDEMKTERGDCRFMFYNIENFFDIYDDSTTKDENFTPDTHLNWNEFRFEKKATNIFKVIAALGAMRPPEIIGFAEVENAEVLKYLTQKTPLSKFDYQIVHQDSPDQRGIDVALIYRSNNIKLLTNEYIEVRFPFDTAMKTRDILYTKLQIGDSSKVHFYINHWSSRFGGIGATHEKRNVAAAALRLHIDSILHIDSCTQIIIAGDFNDNPDDVSIKNVLGTKKYSPQNKCGDLINLMEKEYPKNAGTIKYKSNWNVFDQIIVTHGMMDTNKKLFTFAISAKIAEMPFLLIEDKKYGGLKPYRTYTGHRYKGGFSDHLPIYLDLFFKQNSQN